MFLRDVCSKYPALSSNQGTTAELVVFAIGVDAVVEASVVVVLVLLVILVVVFEVYMVILVISVVVLVAIIGK